MRLNSPVHDDEAPRDYPEPDCDDAEAEQAIRCAENENANRCPCDDCPADANISALCAEHPERCALWVSWNIKSEKDTPCYEGAGYEPHAKGDY